VKGESAKEMGLVDEVYGKTRLVEMAISKHIRGHKEEVSRKGPAKSGGALDPAAREAIFRKARESVLKRTRGHYEAPLRILDLLESSLGDPRSTYLGKEAQLLGELAVSEQSRNLQNIYFLHANSQQYRGPVGSEQRLTIRTGAVVGAGTMGGGIAWLMAKNDMSPILKDMDRRTLAFGLEQAGNIFAEALERRKMREDECKRKQGSIKAQSDYHGFERIDLVVEAVVEEMETKKRVFSEIEKEVSDDCLIASTASTLSVNGIASSLSRPERFAGLHFFSPVHSVPLVEIITHDQVAPGTVSALYEWAVRVKKVPVVVKDGPGFLVNRILTPFMNEALYLLDEGVPIDELEQACLDFGMPIGPCRLLDEVGIDVGHRIVRMLNQATGDRFKPAGLYERLSDLDHYGKKSKKGFFHYDDQGRESGINQDILGLLPAQKISMSEQDIHKRIMMPMINEAATVLQERVVRTVQEIDLGLIFGAGFPRFRGGLLRYADSQGLDNILRALDACAKDLDAERFEACSLLREMAAKQDTFYN
jgi:3-hydroxyacyl-CoA dehydrogenase/enoyl-CoA hydratase/3-hydroxybutyryl-CoA epimerase